MPARPGTAAPSSGQSSASTFYPESLRRTKTPPPLIEAWNGALNGWTYVDGAATPADLTATKVALDTVNKPASLANSVAITVDDATVRYWTSPTYGTPVDMLTSVFEILMEFTETLANLAIFRMQVSKDGGATWLIPDSPSALKQPGGRRSVWSNYSMPRSSWPIGFDPSILQGCNKIRFEIKGTLGQVVTLRFGMLRRRLDPVNVAPLFVPCFVPNLSTFLNALPAFARKGLPATIVQTKPNEHNAADGVSGTYMNLAQLKQLQNLFGWQITPTVWSNADLGNAAVTGDATLVEQSIIQAKKWMRDNGFRHIDQTLPAGAVLSSATTGVDFDPAVNPTYAGLLDVWRKYYSGILSASGSFSAREILQPADVSLLRCTQWSNTNLGTWQTLIDRAIEGKSMFLAFFSGVTAGASTTSAIGAADMAALLDYIDTKNAANAADPTKIMKVLTLQQALEYARAS